MTQLFMGVKPGVGPVVKILKNNGDNPLTLANDAYDKYLFNSENQQLSYTFGNFSIEWDNTTFSTGMHYIGGTSGNAPYVVNSAPGALLFWGRVNQIYPSRPFLPLPEVRVRIPGTSRYGAGRRRETLYIDETFYEEGEVTSYQFPVALMKAQSLTTSNAFTSDNWEGYVQSGLGISVNDWTVICSTTGVVAGGAGFRMNGYTIPDSTVRKVIFNYWNLPADSSSMPTYTSSAGLETLRANKDEFILARPGYSVSGSSGRNQRIIDSTVSPALCVAAGVTPSISASSSYTVSVHPGFTLSETAVVDFMIRKSGEAQYVPCHVPGGYARNDAFDVSYEIDGNDVIIHNEGTGPVIVTYAIYNASEDPPSTGGSLIMFRGNDGTQDFIQIKKPGTSDPASRPQDILLDTRLPTIHILAEGFIPAASFTDPAENTNGLGKYAKEITFNAGGMIPFVKYALVFDNHILTPMCSLYYRWAGGSPTWGPPSNQSSLCRLTSSSAKFWINSGNWSTLSYSGGVVSQVYNGPDPIGIRYYIFGIPT